MDYTTNYHLQSDRIQMEDFNQMCADIDTKVFEGIAGSANALAAYKATNDAALAQKVEQSGMNAAEERITALEQGVALVRLDVVTTTYNYHQTRQSTRENPRLQKPGVPFCYCINN